MLEGFLAQGSMPHATTRVDFPISGPPGALSLSLLQGTLSTPLSSSQHHNI